MDSWTEAPNVDFHTIYTIDVFHTFEDLKATAPHLSQHAFVKMLDHRSCSFGRVSHKTFLQLKNVVTYT